MKRHFGTIELPDLKRRGKVSILNEELTHKIIGSIQLRGVATAATISIGDTPRPDAKEPKKNARRR